MRHLYLQTSLEIQLKNKLPSLLIFFFLSSCNIYKSPGGLPSLITLPQLPLPASSLKPQLSNYCLCSHGAGSQRTVPVRGPRETSLLACPLGLSRMLCWGNPTRLLCGGKSARRSVSLRLKGAIHCVCMYTCVYRKDIII